MPIYEFKCRSCDKEFEKLVFSREDAVCPDCDSRDLVRLMSACSFKSEGGASSASAGSGCGSCSASSCAGCH